MNTDVPRLRIFAGPNGSGKSSIQSVIGRDLLGVYINPDDIEKSIRERDMLDLRAYGVNTTADEILPFFLNSRLSDRAYIFDNTSHEQIWLAEVTDGRMLEMKSAQMPQWFKLALWDKFVARVI